MAPSRGASTGSVLQQAFEEIRFGAARTLNLRTSLPTPAEASRRVESWLRQHQVQQSAEVLIVSGRGNNSEGGISPVREATLRTLQALRRKGVVSSFTEYNAGAFVATLAPVSAMFDAARRRREPSPTSPPVTPPTLATFSAETQQLLRQLAERSLDLLGVRDRSTFVEGEMLRLFGSLASTVEAGADRESRLRHAITVAIQEYD